MNRRIGPFIAAILVAACVYWAVENWAPEGAPPQPASRPAAGPSREVAPPRSAESLPASLPAPIETTPFAESQPASRPESAPYAAVVAFEVVREDGRPITDATISGGIPEPLEVDAQGRAEMPAEPEVTAAIVVTGPNFAPHETSVRLEGSHRIVVPDGARVAGRVTVEGQVPDPALTIAIEDSLPELTQTLSTVTSVEGEFEFFNLAPAWSGRLRVPCEYALIEKLGESRLAEDWCANSRRELHHPDPALHLRLNAYPAIKGRIVPGPTRSGGRGGRAMARFASGAGETGGAVGAASTGHFRILVPPVDPVSATVTVADDVGLGARTFELQGPFDGVRDLGDVELGSVRQIEIRVHDEEGHPVAGALAAVAGTRSFSALTDEEGRTSITADLREQDLRVAKAGYRTSTVRLPPDTIDPVDVRLQAGNRLVIDVKVPDGSAAGRQHLIIQLSARDPIFAGTPEISDELHAMTGATEPYAETTSDEGSEARYELDEFGRVIASGLRPGAHVSVELRGRSLDEVVAESFVVVAPTGTQSVVLTAPREPQSFIGFVRTADGDPIDGAEVFMSVDGALEPSVSVLSGPDGLFLRDHVYALAVNVRIEKEGFVTLNLRDVPVPPPGARRDFILTPSHDVEVFLVDERGELLREEAEVILRISGPSGETWVQAEPVGEDGGAFVIEDLPPGIVEIHAKVGATSVTTTHDTTLPVARVVVPTEGYAEIHWSRPPQETRRCRLVVMIANAAALPSEIALDDASLEHRVELTLDPWLIHLAFIEAQDPETGEWILVTQPVWLEIVAHQRTVVDLGT